MLAVIIAFIITTIMYPGWELYVSNIEEFSFTLAEVGIYFIVYSAFLGIILWAISRIINVKFRYKMYVILWMFTICSYIQGMFLNGKIFLMDGKENDWGTVTVVTNIAVWIIIVVAIGSVYLKFRANLNMIMIYSALALIVMQLAGAGSLIANYINSSEKEYTVNDYLSTEGMSKIASTDNIIIFVLDTYDVDYMNEVLDKYPDFLTPLKGFTYFPDYVSQFSRTYPSLTYMLTGEEYFYEIPQEQYYEEAFTTTGSYFWNGLSEEGFNYYLYEDEEDIIGKSTRINAANYIEEGHQIKARISMLGCINSINHIACYRNLPYVLKNYFNYTAEMINNWTVSERILDNTMFEANDSEVFEYFKKNVLEINNNEDKTLKLFHLNGAHAPYVMNEDGEEVSANKGTAIDQYVGSMKQVFYYLQMLQDIGLYDSATIIITADHGENYVSDELEQNTNPILFIKPKDVVEEDLVISDIYASQNDLLPTICAIYGIEYDENIGINLFDTNGEDKTRVRYHNYTVVENSEQIGTLKYEIIGSSLDFNNWHSMGELHRFGNYY